MHYASTKDRWDHTAMLRSTLINLKVDKNDRVEFEDCHPLRARNRDFSEIKHQIFGGNGNGVRSVN